MGESSVIWTEKYRPSSFDEIRGQQNVVSKVKSFVAQKNLPNLLFAGPAGVGKSSLSLVIAKTLFGSNWRENFLELNASDERGIDIVRVKVKDFARTKALGDVPFKIIFLDECDALTKEAQQALRRTMENYTSNCRFILAANYSSKILDPIQSRCAVFRFRPLSIEDIKALIQSIAKSEGLSITDDAVNALIHSSDGDCRKLENILQSCSSVSKTITASAVYSLSASADPVEVKEVLQLALQSNFIAARDKLLDVMLKYGMSGIDMIKQIQKELWNVQLDDRKRVSFTDKIGEIEFRMVEGSDEFLQLEALIAHISANAK